MRYQVFGRDPESGKEVEPFLVDAEDEQDARNRAAETGMAVVRIGPAPTELPPDGSAQDAPGLDNLVARGLVWVLRVLALVALVWGVMMVSNAVEAYRAANQAAQKVKERVFLVGEEESRWVSKEAERVSTAPVFTAVFSAAALIAILLALAEALRLCIVIEGNTSRAGQLQPVDKGERRSM